MCGKKKFAISISHRIAAAYLNADTDIPVPHPASHQPQAAVQIFN